METIDKELKVRGVYCIKNELNGKVYVGQSVDVYVRILQHRNLYDKDTKNSHLYSAIRKYGLHNFSVTLLEIVGDDDDLNQVETKWINELNSLDNNHGYNTRIEVGDTYRHSEETKIKIQNARKGYVMPIEHKDKLRDSFYKDGHQIDNELLVKRNLAIKSAWDTGKFNNIVRTPNGGQFKVGEPSKFKGMTASDETREKQRLAKLGKKQSKEQIANRFKNREINKVCMFTLNNEFIKRYDNVLEIVNESGGLYLRPGIMSNCNGTKSYYKDKVFKYDKDINLVEKDGVTTFINKDGVVVKSIEVSRITANTDLKPKPRKFSFNIVSEEIV